MIEGTELSGIKIFRGIPFAAPPVGELRWKAPQPVAKWSGVRKAIDYGPDPLQQFRFDDMVFGAEKQSEDCLYLNIWTPARTMKEKLPILIYFNGGGFVGGSGSEYRYAGYSMARKGIISVTCNYREGILGFFAHPALSDESPHRGSGNYGLLDQVAAIQWVKDNIAAFGGDPDRITVAGESAGSYSVSMLMASPLCKGLFSQAIGSSGSMLRYDGLMPLHEAEQRGLNIQKTLGCSTLEELRKLDAEELIKRVKAHHIGNVVNIDRYFLSKQPMDVYQAGEQMRVPLLVGGNSQEAEVQSLLGGMEPTFAHLRESLLPRFGNRTDSLLRWYGLQTDADLTEEGGTSLASDLWIAFSTWKWGQLHSLTGRNHVYRYLYLHPRPAMKGADAAGSHLANGAVHSADIEYAMGNLSTNRVFDWLPDDYIVSDVFMGYYVNFIKIGNPNGIGLPVWAPINEQKVPPMLLIDVDTHQVYEEKTEQRYLFLDRLLKCSPPVRQAKTD